MLFHVNYLLADNSHKIFFYLLLNRDMKFLCHLLQILGGFLWLNPFMPNVISHFYQLDESISN